MIGFGFSAKPPRFEYSILAQADLFEAFLARESISLELAGVGHYPQVEAPAAVLAAILDAFGTACMQNRKRREDER